MKKLKINAEKKASYIGIVVQAPTKELQKEILQDTLIRNWMIAVLNNYTNFNGMYRVDEKNILKFNMPCGEIVKYKTIFDVPLKTTMCPCGNPNYIILKFNII